MRRWLSLLLVAAVARSKVFVHFGQAIEFGVEQLDKDAGTSKITFFAAIRQQFQISEFVLSFGPPQCQMSCAQSSITACPGLGRTRNEDWDDIHIEHYPTPQDEFGAAYLRHTVDLAQPLGCSNEDLVLTPEGNLTGTLYLSLVQGCGDDMCPHYETIELYPFNIAPDLSGLSYKYRSYEFTAEATRNLRVENVGLFVEITTVLTDRQGLELSQFTEPTILHQNCEPELHIVALTNCTETDGSVCTQRIYLAPATDNAMLDNVQGELAIQTRLVGSNGEMETISVLHVSLGIESPVDFGEQSRPVDVFFSVLGDTYVPYLNGSIIDKDYFCVSLASTTLQPIAITSIRTCPATGESCDDNVTAFDLYSLENALINRIASAAAVPLEQTGQSMVCMNFKKLTDGPQFVQVSYQNGAVQSSGNVRRGVYSGETMTPSLVFCDCPWGYHWDEVSESCVHEHDDHWHWSWWWLWIVVGILVVGGIIFCLLGGYGRGDGYDVYIVPTDNPKSYILHEGTQQRIVYVHTEGNSNTVTVTPPHHRRSHRSKTPRPIVEFNQ